jgi:hypothetical protein
MTRLARPTSNGWLGAPPGSGATGPWPPGAGPPSFPHRRIRLPGVGRGARWAGAVTSQPPTGLGCQWFGPAKLTPHSAGTAQQAVEVDDHGQLGPHPTHLGELAALQVAAGQLTEGISAALVTATLVLGAVGAGQRLQGGQDDVAGLGLQQPLEGDHARKGRGQPPSPPPMAALAVAVGAVGIGDLLQMAKHPPQPRWIHAPGRLQQHRLGLGGDLGGQVTGAMGQRAGMGHRDLPGRKGGGGASQRTPEQGPGGPDRAGGGAGAHLQPVAQPAGGRGGLDALLGAGCSPGVDGGQPLEPRTSKRSTNRRSSSASSTRATSVSVFRSSLASSSTSAVSDASRSDGPPGPGDPDWDSNVCSIPWWQPINPPPQHKHQRENVDNFSSPVTHLHKDPGAGRADGPDPPPQAPTWTPTGEKQPTDG